jgi:hypothetical protein
MKKASRQDSRGNDTKGQHRTTQNKTRQPSPVARGTDSPDIIHATTELFRTQHVIILQDTTQRNLYLLESMMDSKTAIYKMEHYITHYTEPHRVSQTAFIVGCDHSRI